MADIKQDMTARILQIPMRGFQLKLCEGKAQLLMTKPENGTLI